jgi:hypothetical protein
VKSSINAAILPKTKRIKVLLLNSRIILLTRSIFLFWAAYLSTRLIIRKKSIKNEAVTTTGPMAKSKPKVVRVLSFHNRDKESVRANRTAEFRKKRIAVPKLRASMSFSLHFKVALLTSEWVNVTTKFCESSWE